MLMNCMLAISNSPFSIFLCQLYRLLRVITLLFLFGLIVSCTKEEVPEPIIRLIETSNGVSAEDLEQYQGEIGLLIDLRPIVKLGYQPVEVKIETSARQYQANQTASVDPLTSIARIVVPVEELTDEAEAELRGGVELSVQVMDQMGKELLKTTFGKTSWRESGTLLEVELQNLEEQFQRIDFKPGVPHFFQIYFIRSAPYSNLFSPDVAFIPPGNGDKNSFIYRYLTIPGDKPFDYAKSKRYAQFYFQPYDKAENIYAVYAAHTKRYLAIDDNDDSWRQSGAYSYREDISDLHPRYLFKVGRGIDGTYTLTTMDGRPLRRTEQRWAADDRGGIAHFRIIALDIDWQTEVIETRQMQPIFPAAETSFGFNSTLINCGTGELQQEVGVERTETSTYTTSFEESIGFAGRVTTTTGASVTASAEANFFGNKGSVSGTVSAELDIRRSNQNE